MLTFYTDMKKILIVEMLDYLKHIMRYLRNQVSIMVNSTITRRKLMNSFDLQIQIGDLIQKTVNLNRIKYVFKLLGNTII